MGKKDEKKKWKTIAQDVPFADVTPEIIAVWIRTAQFQRFNNYHAHWRRENPGARLNLCGLEIGTGLLNFTGPVDLSNVDLDHASLRCLRMYHATLAGASLRYADLSYADLVETRLEGTDLSYADLKMALIPRADHTVWKTVRGLETARGLPNELMVVVLKRALEAERFKKVRSHRELRHARARHRYGIRTR